ncbi:MAG TPA: GAF domain-containing protein [Candidatus Binatia bacterium]|nr:GAF domain-containing protein [Candidatus Binatia bacterium]
MPDTKAQDENEKILAVVMEEFRFASRVVVCAFYISWWRIKRYIWTDSKLRTSATVAALLASCVLLVEILLTFFHHEVAGWLGKFAAVVLVPAASILIIHRVEEFHSRQKESSFARRVTPLVDAFADLSRAVNAPPEQQEKQLDAFVQKVLTQICEDIGGGAKNPVTTSIMMYDEAEQALAIVYLFPVGTKYDPAIRFKTGEGAAGFCYQKGKTVYIPSIRYMHGIVIGEAGNEVSYGLRRRLYIPIVKEYEIYESILCLPLTSGRGGTEAVMNVDSTRADAFSMHDVDVLKAYARILADAISLFM